MTGCAEPAAWPLRLVFAGTPEFAREALAAIVAAGHEVALVLTQPDRPAGRGMQAKPSPVKQWAQVHGLAVEQPVTLRAAAVQERLAGLQADAWVVAAYGLILPQPVLELAPWGCLNIHASLLPRWRGAAPVHRAIEAGDAQTGITIMRMDAGLDTGPILAMHPLAIAPDETTGSLSDRLGLLGAQAIVAALARLKLDLLPGHAQPHLGVTYAHKVTRAEALIDWSAPAPLLAQRVRAFDPFPGSCTVLQGQLIKVWAAHSDPEPCAQAPGTVVRVDAQAGVQVACGMGHLWLGVLQRPGGRRLGSVEFLQGMPIALGSVFGV